MSSSKVVVIGAGVSGLSCAALLAQKGYQVTLLEKNDGVGGRCRKFEAEGFTFDMGPSWYWMPDVFENFFKLFNKTTDDLYKLHRLDPSYQVYFKDEAVSIPANYDELKVKVESWEQGAGDKLDQFMLEAEKKYKISMSDLVYQPSLSLLEFANKQVLGNLFSMDLFQSFQKHTERFFSHPKILQLLEFPILFLGATANDTPALYSLMNYADVKLGTWYPEGGMHKIGEGFASIAKEQGVKIVTNTSVKGFNYKDKKIVGVRTDKEYYDADVVVASSDYHHSEQLLSAEFRNYREAYWEGRKMAPSSLLFYLGVDKKIPELQHHNLFFDTDFSVHADEIYKKPQWPSKPLFYVCCPSKTDATVAPEGKENLFLLMPLAAGIEDTENLRNQYLDLMLARIKDKIAVDVKPEIIYQRSYCINDFISDYNSYKGNAYGLANVLMQTAVFKPRLVNKKLKNLYYAGQLTVPGPGLPPAIISGQIVADLVAKNHSS